MGTRGWLRRLTWLVVSLLLLQSAGILVQAHETWIHQFDNNFTGYQDLSQQEYNQLVADTTEVEIPLAMESIGHDEWNLHFQLDKVATLYLSASAGSSQVPLVQPLIVQPDNGLRFLLPLIRSAQPGRRIDNAITVGRFGAGDHTLRLSQNAASTMPIPDSLRLRLSRPAHDSVLSTFMAHTPVLKLKNPANVLDDMPLLGYIEIGRDGTGYQVKTSVIFSSENGGMMPDDLLAKMGRTVDIEWVTKQIYTASHDRLSLRFGQFQTRDHQEEKIAGASYLSGRPVLSIATPNNNFADGRVHFGRWSVSDPFKGIECSSICYAPKPLLLPPQQWSLYPLQQVPEMQQWSLFELAQEGCVDLSDVSNPRVAAFVADLTIVRQFVHTSYTPRGCSHDDKIALS